MSRPLKLATLLVGYGPIGPGVIAALILDSREVDIASHVHELIEGVGTDVICGAADMEKAFLAVNPACRAQGTFQGSGWLGIETCFAG
ncbi:uncharacterized protein N7484_005975 [Penicillium longicatenatum]|uniref:uncharacterized protein n=1 Tax=Penicillium longicatenatum TaxID=1561947 RepID=UPI0025477BCC|nr:uncharacterized protein N7484_005975 [Penicillium longicatenatum]KAJ5643468.1 hypothetical protein N7484_005975 [Penicillium longicatenatum]